MIAVVLRGSRRPPGVVGPLAPSQTISRLDRAALSAVITCSSAAGTSTSQSQVEQLLVGDRVAAGKPVEHAVLGLVVRSPPRCRGRRRCGCRRRESETAIDAHALLGEQAAPGSSRRCRSPGSRRGCRARRRALLLERSADAVQRRRARSLLASDRAADRDRLAGDDAEHRVADDHRVGVEHPRHHLRVGADVGRGDVLLRPDLVMISLV